MAKILAIDDKKENLIALTALLKTFMPGCSVIIAQSGAEGLKKAKTEFPDTILLDTKMPGMDGYEVCNKLKNDETTKHIPVIMISAINIETEKIIKGLETGADAYLAKPIDEALLVTQVKTALRIKKAEDRLRNQKGLLEEMVLEKTLELSRTNKQLKQQIEEQKRTKNALQESELKYRSMTDDVLDTSSVGIFILDSDFKVVWINNTLEHYFDLQRKYIIGNDNRQLIQEQIKDIFEDPVTFAKKVFATYDDNTYIEQFECHILPNSKRKERWLEHWSQPIRSGLYNGGRVEHYSDITDRKLAEAERERLISAIEQAAEIVVITDSKGTIQYVNPAFEQITGYTRAEVVGHHARVFKSDEHDGTFYREMWKTLTRGKVWRGRFINKKKDGSLYTEEAVISPVRDALGKSVNYVAVKRDITAEMKLEEQLRQAQKMEAIGTLAGGIAHDFNNILTTIIGNAQLALLDGIKNESLRKEIEEIKKAGERAASLTRQLLAFSRKQIVRPEVMDINNLLVNMEKMLGRLIREDVKLLTILKPELWHVEIDPGQIEQVIMNLVINARDSIPEGGKITIETANMYLDRNYFREHGIKGEIPGDYVMVAVSDTGSGMDKEIQEHIFEPFFTTKEVGKGTGLGLSTVYGIVKQNNGFIWIYSEPGQGSVFKVYLPKVKSNADLKGKGQTQMCNLGGSETVLIVEDDDSLRNFAQKTLQSYGYRILNAENGAEALRICKEHDGEIDLMVTDVVMPKMGGREAVELIRPLYPHMKIIYMSGYTDNAIVNHGVLEPGLNFIQKPFTPEGLTRKVREALDNV